MTGAHRRIRPLAVSVMPAITTRGRRRAERRGQRRCAARHVLQLIEHDRHDRDRCEHQDRARDGRRKDVSEQREARGEDELDQCEDHDQGREQRRAAGGEGRRC